MPNNRFYCKIIIRNGGFLDKKLFYKITIVLTILFIFLLLNSNICFATGTIDTNVQISNKFKSEAEPVGNRIIGVLQVIGTFVAVGMTMTVGIKYMLCSVEEKAEYKKTALLYIVGALLIFVTPQIISLINDVIN